MIIRKNSYEEQEMNRDFSALRGEALRKTFLVI